MKLEQNFEKAKSSGTSPFFAPAKDIFCLFLILFFLQTCQKKPTLFQNLPAKTTGITFRNDVEESDSINVLDYMNIYTGAGVAAGDLNGDGLVDLFFSANRRSSRLFLNRGDLKFDDATEKAGLKTTRWCTGATVADINQDGRLDVYVSVSGNPKWGSTANLLFENQGNAPDGTPIFLEKAAEYGLADPRLCLNATFLDYDGDLDLDLFLITNPADQLVAGVNNIVDQTADGAAKGVDILYRNDGKLPSSGGAGGGCHFTDVSKKAGIVKDGYSLGSAVADFNADGRPDIYVANDFLSSDILYLNNGDGTFTDRTRQAMRHTSFASMGCDAADVNDDGLPDLFTLDMLPEGHFRRKMLIPAVNIDKFEMAVGKGYVPQYTRNALQMNCGFRISDFGDAAKNPKSEIQNPKFQEVGLMAGIAATDWSWAPLFADFDLDGDKDLLVTNGFWRDLGNLDYINYQFSKRSPMGTSAAKRAQKLADIHGLESVPLQDYLFENNGDMTFSKRSDDWGFAEKGFSNGACFADLDNDGDLEIVINQFNSEAKIFKNTARERAQKGQPASHFLTLKLEADAPNLRAFGAKIWLHLPDGKTQFQEIQPVRGYESTVDGRVFFGLGKNEKADSVVIFWPDDSRQVLKNLAADQFLEVKKAVEKVVGEDAKNGRKPDRSVFFQEKKQNAPAPAHFTPLPSGEGLGVGSHVENHFIDFKSQILLPHQHSKSGPAIASGDVNGDGLDDFYRSSAMGETGVLAIQKPTDNGFFKQKLTEKTSLADETAALFFDADADGDLDLFVGKGGSEHPENAPELMDELFLNDGNGHFSKSENALPESLRNAAGGAAACDFDRDGDVDLFVGGRVRGGEWPKKPRSILLKNESKKAEKGQPATVRFIDATPDFLKNAGMISTAVWGDFDSDGWPDLAVAGEFLAVQIFKNEKGQLINATQIHHSSFNIQHSKGWWNALAAADFDRDGDLDLIGGNLGLNARYRASATEPLSVFAGDFDKNGSIDPVFVHFEAGERFIFTTRDELAAQVPAMKKRFSDYSSFAKNTFEKSFRPDEIAAAFELKAECFESSFFENLGNGKFARRALPMPAQVAPIQAFLIEDFDHDGHLDALAAGNFYAAEYTSGRYDASAGAFLKGDGKGNFTFLENRKTGFWADGDARSLAILRLKNGRKMVVVGNNGSKMQGYLLK